MEQLNTSPINVTNLNTSHLNSEMSDLVHHAEEWAGGCANPEVAFRELKTQRLGRQILTRAALVLLGQMGIKTEEEYKKWFGGIQMSTERIDVVRDDRLNSPPVSPMTVDEFQNILKNGWPGMLDEPLPGSPGGGQNARRRTSMLADFIPMSPIVSESSHVSPEKRNRVKTVFKAPDPKAHNVRKTLFTSTPKQKPPPMRRTNSVPGTPNQTLRTPIATPKRTTSTPTLSRQSPAPLDNETPLENRASRLRRLKLEEKMRSLGGRENLNFSF